MILPVAQIKEMAIRPRCQFFQNDEGKIKRSVRENRMRQAAIVAALLVAKKGVGTIVSSKKFSTQNWRLIMHPKVFFDKRPKLMSEFEKFYKPVEIDTSFELPKLDEKKDFFLECKEELPDEPYRIFKALQFTEEFDVGKRVSFWIRISLVGKMIKPDS